MITLQERKNLEKQLAALEEREASNSVASGGITRKEKDAAEDEVVAKKQFDNYNTAIASYELEIEGMIGEFITSPFTETDVDEHAREFGRMYQGVTSTAPKTIPEMFGGGISPDKKPIFEISNFIPLKEIIDTILHGKLPVGTGSGSLYVNYSYGDTTIKVNSPLTSGWFCVGGVSLVKISTIVHVPAQQATSAHCSIADYSTPETCASAGGNWIQATPAVNEHWVCTIEETHTLGFHHGAIIGSDVYPWRGYTDTERRLKEAASTNQSMLNESISILNTYTDKWLESLGKCCSGLTVNTDKKMRIAEKQSTLDLRDYVLNYRLTTPIHDGPFDIFIQKILDREVFIPTRVQHCRDDKSAYYQDRYGMCKFRCDIQSGTLTRTKFLVTLRGFYPSSGDPTLKEQMARIKNILQSG